MDNQDRNTSAAESRSVADQVRRFLLKSSLKFSGLWQVPVLGEVFPRLSHRVLRTKHRVWIQVRKGVGEGLWLKLNPRAMVRFYAEDHDLALRDILRKYLRPGMVFYDLGSNLGLFALVAAGIVGPDGKVLAFEPEPELAEPIMEHIERNGCANVHLVRSAVWSRTGFVGFSREHAFNSVDHGLGKVSSEPAGREPTISVPCIALDAFVLREPPPDFIKCDVEGAEVEVFEGARRMLAEYMPIVECEVHSDVNGVLLTNLFQELGYALEWYARDHFLALPNCSRGAPPPLNERP